jgi:hypothetical protein
VNLQRVPLFVGNLYPYKIEQGTAALAEGWQLPAAAKVEF